MKTDAYLEIAKSAIANRPGWFDILLESGTLQNWLDSPDYKVFEYGVFLLNQPDIISQRGSKVAQIITDHLPKNLEDKEKATSLLGIFDSDRFFPHDGLCNVFFNALDNELFDGKPREWWNHFWSFPRSNPDAAARLMNIIFNRYIEFDESKATTDGIIDPTMRIFLPAEFLIELVKLRPSEVLDTILPIVSRLIQKYEVESSNGCITDRVWPFLSMGGHGDLKDLILRSTARCMAHLAENSPSDLDSCTKEIESKPHKNFSYLLLSSWEKNGERYGNRIVDYLLELPCRLNIGYGMWSSGNGVAAVSRSAVATASRWANEEKLRSLESLILEFIPEIEKGNPRDHGYTQLLLLHSLDKGRIGEKAKTRLKELDRKFPHVDLREPEQSVGMSVVKSPIPPSAAKRMTDDQWVNALSKHEHRLGNSFDRAEDGTFIGGAYELSQILEKETRLNKDRFGRLFRKLPDGTSEVYFNAMLRGLVATHEVEAGEEAEEIGIDFEDLLSVFRYAHNLSNHPCGRWLCSSIGDVAERGLSDDIVKIVVYYALNDPDPDESEDGDVEDFGGDLTTRGINTTRGAAADALADLLFADAENWTLIKKGVQTLVQDRAWSVRAVAVRCLTALLRIDRNLSVKWFVKMVDESPRILGSLFVEEYLHYAVYSHYSTLRHLLMKMLADTDVAIREFAAGAIFNASFRNDEARKDVRKVMASGEECRNVISTISANVLKHPEFRDWSVELLVQLFDDESLNVRESAAQCFYNISDQQIAREATLIDSFLHSKSFPEQGRALVWNLEKSVEILPEVICEIPERVINIVESDDSGSPQSAIWWARDISKLVLRLYEQSKKPEVKTRCLNIIDKMIILGLGNVYNELDKLERA